VKPVKKGELTVAKQKQAANAVAVPMGPPVVKIFSPDDETPVPAAGFMATGFVRNIASLNGDVFDTTTSPATMLYQGVAAPITNQNWNMPVGPVPAGRRLLLQVYGATGGVNYSDTTYFDAQ
jgi:hypothetical protein